MNVLLDTHAVIWWLSDPGKLSKHAMSIMRNGNNKLLLSAAVGWELAIKVNVGKLDALATVLELMRHAEQEAFQEQAVTLEQAIRAGLLPLHHRDPFDRLLVAQAQELGVPILSADAALDRYDVKRIW